MPGKEKIKPRKKNTRQEKNTRTEIRQNKTERNCQTSIKNKGKNFRQENIPGKEKIKPRLYGHSFLINQTRSGMSCGRIFKNI